MCDNSITWGEADPRRDFEEARRRAEMNTGLQMPVPPPYRTYLKFMREIWPDVTTLTEDEYRDEIKLHPFRSPIERPPQS